jgi:hypothetical protein
MKIFDDWLKALLTALLHSQVHIYIYIYIYLCVCVCMYRPRTASRGTLQKKKTERIYSLFEDAGGEWII